METQPEKSLLNYKLNPDMVLWFYEKMNLPQTMKHADRGKKMKIIVVDDELVSRKKMHKIMSGFGECESAESGSIALSLIESALELHVPFVLMTLDIEMPEMSGIDVIKLVRALERKKGVKDTNKLKILMVTSHSDKDNVKKCIEAGCDNYIVKPFDKDLVILKLKQLNINV